MMVRHSAPEFQHVCLLRRRRPPRIMSTQFAVVILLFLLIDSSDTRRLEGGGGYGTLGDSSSSPLRPTLSPPPPLQERASLDNASTQLITPPPQPPLLVWKKDRFPASDFREESTTHRFLLWPDNLTYIRFEYFCQQDYNPQQELKNFRYKEGEMGRLYTSPYYDLGVVDKYNTPYFRRWRIDWRIDPLRIICSVRCEYTDLKRLYDYRLQRNVMSSGFVYGLGAILIVQLGVIAFITLWSLVNHYRAGATPREPLIKVVRQCYRAPSFWLNFVPDWIHLVLLNMLGFAMMEAAGHSSFFRWRALLFYNMGVTYTYLTLAAMLSSLLFECAVFVQSHRESQPHDQRPSVQALGDQQVPNPSPAATRILSTTTSKRHDPGDEMKNLVRKTWTDDWKYQRIFGQIGVLILMVMYLSSVDDEDGDDMNSLASVVAGCLTVACIWSFAVSTVSAVRSFRSIFVESLKRQKPE